MKKLSFLSIITILLTSCGSINDAGKVLRNEKIKTTDEFLVKKRNPLVLPPNYEEIPKPGTKLIKKKTEEETIKKILKAPKTENILQNKSSSVEDSILNRIRK
jgi:hypothetical protein|tara:strand:+ start:1600 stop:1908 length:309 start_codon:yes stop_codon:yes gene_type:complete